MEKELKPCPFCGKTSALEIMNIDDGYAFYVKCSWVKGGCGILTGGQETIDAAIDFWNTRAESEVIG